MSIKKEVEKDLKLGSNIVHCDYCYLFHHVASNGCGKQVYNAMACNHALGVKVRFLQEKLSTLEEALEKANKMLAILEKLDK